MQLIWHEQGNLEWLRWRMGGIGGSDVAKVMRCCIHGTREELFALKLGAPPEEADFAMRQGNKLEPMIRRWAGEYWSESLEPACCELEPGHWMRASLDGMNIDGSKIAEFKFLKACYHEMALAGNVPAHHYPQLQHNLLVSGAAECLYVTFNNAKSFKPGRSFATVAVRPDAEFMARMLEEEEVFWAEVTDARKRLLTTIGGAA